jgi:hypothetical protein
VHLAINLTEAILDFGFWIKCIFWFQAPSFNKVPLASGGDLTGASFIVGEPDNYAPPITHRQNARGTAPLAERDALSVEGELGIGNWALVSNSHQPI